MADDSRPRILDDEFDFNAADLSKQFEQLLRTRRLNELEQQARTPRSSSPHIAPQTPRHHSYAVNSPQPSIVPSSRSSQHHPPTYTNFRSYPIVPSPPQDGPSLRFRSMLITLSMTPVRYENPGLLDEALTHVPIDRIYAEAEEEHNLLKGLAASKGDNVKPEWGYQDCVIRSLLRYAVVHTLVLWCNSNLALTGGSSARSLPSSTTLLVHGVMVPLSLEVRFLLQRTKLLVEQPRQNYTNARPAKPLRDSLDMAKSGHCSRLEEAEQESLRTASACCAVRPVPECAGCGIAKTMCGLRSTASTKGDGSILTLARRCGITQESILKVRQSTITFVSS